MSRGDRSKYWKYSFSGRKPTSFEKRVWSTMFRRYLEAKEDLLAAPAINGQWGKVDPRVLVFDVKTKETMVSAIVVLKLYLEQGWCPKPDQLSIMIQEPIPVLVKGSRLEQRVSKAVAAGLRTSQDAYNRGMETIRRYGLDNRTSHTSGPYTGKEIS